MQSFTFHELSERAKITVELSYSKDFMEAIKEVGAPNDDETFNLFVNGWLFNEHGERIIN